ncbi:hypothetical protein Tco_1479055 [Tanacetum coccineum]
MLKSFNRKDLEDLYKLVKAKYESTRPVEDLDLLLWGDLKIMFELHVKDNIWKNQQEYKVLDWKLYDSSEVNAASENMLEVNAAGENMLELNAASENMLEITTASEYQVNAAS